MPGSDPDPSFSFDPIGDGEDEGTLESFAPDFAVAPTSESTVLATTGVQPPSAAPLQSGALAVAEVPAVERVRFHEPALPKASSEEQKNLVMDAVKDYVLYGVRAAAMVCHGTGNEMENVRPCPYLAKCPLYRYEYPLPTNDECPVELSALYTWTESLMREMKVNPHDVNAAYDSAVAKHMAGLQLQIHRALWGEALDPRFEREMDQMTPGGGKFKILVANMNTEARERALKMLSKLGRDNMQTRERKVALTKAGFRNKSQHAADVATRIEQIRKDRLAEVEEIVETGPDGVVKKLSRIQRFTPGEPED